MAKPFKRYFTGSKNRSGKGDDRREAQVSEQQVAENWCHAFGHRPDNSEIFKKGSSYYAPCKCCGASLLIAELTKK